MRALMVLVLVVLATWSTPNGARAESANACKQCGDQRRACASNYSAQTCKTEYEICMKNCGKK